MKCGSIKAGPKYGDVGLGIMFEPLLAHIVCTTPRLFLHDSKALFVGYGYEGVLIDGFNWLDEGLSRTCMWWA